MTRTPEPRSRDASLRASYDHEAANYDAARYQSAEGRFFNDLEVRLLRSWLSPRPGVKVLDVPAGTGRLSVALGTTGATVVAADISFNMLVQAAAKRSGRELDHVHFTQATGVQLPFADSTFDAVISFKFFHLVPNDRKPLFVREMTRVLKPGGALVIEFNSPFYGVGLAALRYYLRKSRPGGMRTKCIFPDQVSQIFKGLEVKRTYGLKLPFSGLLSRVFGNHSVAALNLWFGRLPGVKYLTYAIMIEARKPLSSRL